MRKNKVITITIVLILVTVVGAYYLFIITRESAPINDSKNNDTQASLEIIKESPATDQEKAESQTAKEELVNNPNTRVIESGGRKQINVVITDYSPTVIGSFIEGVVEDGGVCTATFTKDSSSFNKVVSAIANVSTSQCERVSLSPSDFPSKGLWSASISYSSSSSTGTSQPVTINIE